MIVFDEDENLYRFSDALDYEYDVAQFLAALERAGKETGPDQEAAAYRAAALYKGAYLPGVETEWTLRERRRLQKAYLETLLKLAKRHLGRGEYEAVLSCCERALTEALLERAKTTPSHQTLKLYQTLVYQA